MSHASDRTFTGDFRRFFLRGLVVLLPSVLTLWIVVKAYQFVDKSIAQPINGGVRMAMMQAAPVWEPLRDAFDPTPEEIEQAKIELRAGGRPVPEGADVLLVQLRRTNINRWWAEHAWYMDLIGLVVAIIAVYISGRLLGGFFGRQIYQRIERLVTSLPVFKQVYPSVKQVVDFLFADDKGVKFNRVVCVQYPRAGIWTIGFLTGGSMKQIEEHAGAAVTVFIPSSPTPFTGYTITVPQGDVMDLPITVEEALRFTVSGGVLVPGRVAGTLRGGESRPEAASGIPSLSTEPGQATGQKTGEQEEREASPDASKRQDAT